ncbi:TetR/AcrR family transcriptional regulator [Colwellia psychrerythraea]|uniref:Transcriptional regulator, TetR family n=1 Tax=Colwellia psychrerythraea TaxID=28229 RepID=A0A099KI52_COLPS|nr:TetR family transcriptional regulator [Colwellia psychrerythraea]KGJ90036.1 transcriptional regulator, TetR family [Colwellia psychrerythraea]
MPIEELSSLKLAQQKISLPVKKRSKGEITREKILIAAIEVLALNGIKGTTHRAIASHADLQLSLTTYYFKDIQELIYQAFKLNSNRILSRSDTILKDSILAITKIDKNERRKKAVKEKLCQQLSEITAKHLIANIKHQAISLAVEQLMLTEIQVTPELKSLIQTHELAQLAPFEQLCRFFNKVNPELDARIMYTQFTQLQYGQLTTLINIDSKLIRQTIHRIFTWVM